MTTLTKTLSTGVLAAAIMLAPVFALAHTGDKATKARASASLGSAVQVFTNNDGDTVVRGALVTDISDDEITARTYWLGRTNTWTIETDSSTEYVRRDGTSSSRSSIEEGDHISFSGSLESAYRIDANVVKNWSVPGTQVALAGTVTDVASGSLTLATAMHGTITVDVTGDTDYVGGIEALGDIDVDSKLIAYGSYDADTKVLTATKVSLSGKAWADKDHSPKGHAWGHWMKRLSGYFNWR